MKTSLCAVLYSFYNGVSLLANGSWWMRGIEISGCAFFNTSMFGEVSFKVVSAECFRTESVAYTGTDRTQYRPYRPPKYMEGEG